MKRGIEGIGLVSEGVGGLLTVAEIGNLKIFEFVHEEADDPIALHLEPDGKAHLELFQHALNLILSLYPSDKSFDLVDNIA